MPIDAVIDDRESPKPEDEVENISRIQAQNQTQSQMLFPMQSAAQTQNSGLAQNNSHKQERDESSNGIQPITSHHPARTASANQGPAMLQFVKIVPQFGISAKINHSHQLHPRK